MSGVPAESMIVIIGVEADSEPEEVNRSLRSIGAASANTQAHVRVSVAVPDSFLTEQLESTYEAAPVELVKYGADGGGLAQCVNGAFRQSSEDVVIVLVPGVMIGVATLSSILAELHSTDSGVLRFGMAEIRSTERPTQDELNDVAVYGVKHRANVAGLPRGESTGFIAARRQAFHILRGFDEELVSIDSAVRDFACRAQRLGVHEKWINDRNCVVFRCAVRMNSRRGTRPSVSPERHAPARAPIFRNLNSWGASSPPDGPLVSIVISTFNRAEYLPDCINSILGQTFEDFEVIIVDDGSTDNTQEVVESFAEPRIKYFRRANSGISASRNFGTQVARGYFIAVHDDDDIMLPWRLEFQLTSFAAGDHGSFGVSIHFDNDSGEMHRLTHRRFNMQTALRYGQNPTHPTWLVRRDVMASFEYDETLKSGVDNNLALRMVRSGIVFRHCGESLILRRVHGGQITRTAGEIQNSSAKMSRQLLNFTNGLAENPYTKSTEGEWLPSTTTEKPYEQSVIPYLPDHLVTRRVAIESFDSEVDIGDVASSIGECDSLFTVDDRSGWPSNKVAEVFDVSLSGLARLRLLGLDFRVSATSKTAVHSKLEPAESLFEWIYSNYVPLQPDQFRVVAVATGKDQNGLAEVAKTVQGAFCTARNGEWSGAAFISGHLTAEAAVELQRNLSNTKESLTNVFMLAAGPEPFSPQLVAALDKEERTL
ncbi:glycosyltransferase family 2 protein [Arthrobacter monumenti]